MQGRRIPHTLALAAFAAGCLVWTGCGAPPPLAEDELFARANHQFETQDFAMATIHYDELLEQYPFSDLAELARLRIAHAYYLGGSYDKAIAAFSDFERLHPTSPLLPFVEYTIGMSHLDQARPNDRDKTASENALRQFERVRDRYPGSMYGRLAEYRVHECRENLANHELHVGDYYLQAGKHDAGIARYRFVLEVYPDTDSATLAARRLQQHAAASPAE